MTLNISKEIAALQRMTVPELRRKYAEVFGESTTSRHKQFLIRRILWRMQANLEGDLSERARQRAKELAADSDVRLTAPVAKAVAPGPEAEARIATIQLSQDDRLPMPGAIITRRYKGQMIEVRVLPHGFEHEGEVYRTLSAVAKQVTGTHWNGSPIPKTLSGVRAVIGSHLHYITAAPSTAPHLYCRLAGGLLTR